jgi:uncharacterized protein (TIGR02145 family)
MKTKPSLPLLIINLSFILTLSACKKDVAPTVTTSQVSNITENSAFSGGNVKSDGGAMVTERGVCWSPEANPVSQLVTRTNEGGGIGTYLSYITGLTTGKTYHVRAYATNSVGTSYGTDFSFSTIMVVAPVVENSAISAVSSTRAVSGGRVTDLGGASAVEHGVCWSTNPDPTVEAALYTSEYGDIGKFTNIITGLTPNTHYYLRAYASNQADTVYADQVTFTTTPDVTDIDGTVYGTVNIGTQVWLTENLATTKYNDDKPIPLVSDQTAWNYLTTPGYCWYHNDRSANGITNGAIYNWHAVNTGKLCPAGWHVPSDTEWTTLTTFLGGETVAGGKMQTYNDPYNSLFWAVVCSNRDTIIGFEEPTGCGGLTNSRWWSSKSSGAWEAWSHWLSSSSEIFRTENSKKYGLSVRCLKD